MDEIQRLLVEIQGKIDPATFEQLKKYLDEVEKATADIGQRMGLLRAKAQELNIAAPFAQAEQSLAGAGAEIQKINDYLARLEQGFKAAGMAADKVAEKMSFARSVVKGEKGRPATEVIQDIIGTFQTPLFGGGGEGKIAQQALAALTPPPGAAAQAARSLFDEWNKSARQFLAAEVPLPWSAKLITELAKLQRQVKLVFAEQPEQTQFRKFLEQVPALVDRINAEFAKTQKGAPAIPVGVRPTTLPEVGGMPRPLTIPEVAPVAAATQARSAFQPLLDLLRQVMTAGRQSAQAVGETGRSAQDSGQKAGQSASGWQKLKEMLHTAEMRATRYELFALFRQIEMSIPLLSLMINPIATIARGLRQLVVVVGELTNPFIILQRTMGGAFRFMEHTLSTTLGVLLRDVLLASLRGLDNLFKTLANTVGNILLSPLRLLEQGFRRVVSEVENLVRRGIELNQEFGLTSEQVQKNKKVWDDFALALTKPAYDYVVKQIDALGRSLGLLGKGDWRVSLVSLGSALGNELQSAVQSAVNFFQQLFGGGGPFDPAAWARGAAALVGAFASGLVSGLTGVIAAVSNIASTIAGFLIGLSPPPLGPLRRIILGGKGLIESYLAGMLEADFSALDRLTGLLSSKLELARAASHGAILETDVAAQTRAGEELIAQGLAEITTQGQIAAGTLAQLKNVFGDLFGDVQNYLAALASWQAAQRAVEAAQEAYNNAAEHAREVQEQVQAAVQAQQDILDAIQAKINDFNLRSGEIPERFTRGRRMELEQERQKAEERLKQIQREGQERERVAQRQVEAARKQLEAAQKQEQAAQRYLQLMEKLLQADEKRVKDAAKAAGTVGFTFKPDPKLVALIQDWIRGNIEEPFKRAFGNAGLKLQAMLLGLFGKDLPKDFFKGLQLTPEQIKSIEDANAQARQLHTALGLLWDIITNRVLPVFRDLFFIFKLRYAHGGITEGIQGVIEEITRLVKLLGENPKVQQAVSGLFTALLNLMGEGLKLGIGASGVLADAIGAILDALIAYLKEADPAKKTGIGESLGKGIGDALTKWAKTFQKFGDLMGVLLGHLDEWMQSPQAKQLFLSLGTLIVGGILQAVRNAFANPNNLLSDVVIGTTIGGAAALLAETIGMLVPLILGFLSILIRFGAFILDYLVPALTAFGAVLAGVTLPVWLLIAAIAGLIIEIILIGPQAWQAASKLVETWSYIETYFVIKMLTGLDKFIKDLKKLDWKSALADLYDAFVQPFVDIWNALFGHSWIPKTESGFDDFIAFLTGLSSRITQSLSGVGDAMNKALEGVWNKLPDWYRNPVDWFKQRLGQPQAQPSGSLSGQVVVGVNVGQTASELSAEQTRIAASTQAIAAAFQEMLNLIVVSMKTLYDFLFGKSIFPDIEAGFNNFVLFLYGLAPQVQDALIRMRDVILGVARDLINIVQDWYYPVGQYIWNAVLRGLADSISANPISNYLSPAIQQAASTPVSASATSVGGIAGVSVGTLADALVAAVPNFQWGGVMLRSGLAYVHAGESVGRGGNYQITIQNNWPEGIERMDRQAFEKIAEEASYKAVSRVFEKRR